MSTAIAPETTPGPRRGGQPYGRQFIDLAGLGSNTWRNYAAALLRIILYPLAAAVLLGLISGIAVFVSDHALEWLHPAVAILAQFGLIVVAGGAVLRSVERSHHRPWRSLVAADLRIDYRRLAIGLGVEFAILAGQLALVHVLTGWPWGFSTPAMLPPVLMAIVLIPLQAASEEILFRGYLTQALGRLVRSRVLLAMLVGLVFGVLHLNTHGPVTVPYFLVLSLILSLVALRDERLELAIGGHCGMNLFAFAAANSTLIGPGVVGLDDAGIPFNWAAIAVLIVNGALFYAITRLFVRLLCERRAAVAATER